MGELETRDEVVVGGRRARTARNVPRAVTLGPLRLRCMVDKEKVEQSITVP